MAYELILDLAYMGLALLLFLGERKLAASGWGFSGLSLTGIADPLTGLVVGLFGITLFLLVVFVGTTPPMLIHDLASHSWHYVPGRHADLTRVGPIGNLAQIVGALTAGWLFFRATWVVLAVAFGFAVASHVFQF